MDYKGCVVIQGPINKTALPKIREGFKGYQLIFSTWEGVHADDFYDNETLVISKQPSDTGPKNINLQAVSTINGFQHAKNLGWNRALKWRSDMWCDDGDKLFGLFKNGLNFYSWAHHGSVSYVTDYFMEGQVDEVMNLFYTGYNDIPYPEWCVTKNLYDSGLNKKAGCIGMEFTIGNDVYWEGRNFYLSSNFGDDVFRYSLPESWNG